jgi:hypothetical protein
MGRWALIPALFLVGNIAAGEALAQQSGQPRSDTRDILVCYQFDAFDEVYKLNIKPHSKLSERKEEREFDHSRQFAFSVHGKHVGTCGFGTVRPVAGTLISTVPVGTAGGARLGLVSFNTTGVPNFCRDVEVSCKSADEGFPPRAWNCFGQNKFDIEFEFTLEQVKEDEDERCSLFEDGFEDDDSFFDQLPGEGGGTGMQPSDEQ